MKKLTYNIYALALVGLLAACTSDLSEPQEATFPLHLRSLGVPEQQAVTRASFQVNDYIYFPYIEMYPQPLDNDYTTIGCFLVQDRVGRYDNVSGVFRYKTANEWTSTVGIKAEDYYIFAFMPSNAQEQRASITYRPGSTTWADGAKMVIEGIQTVTPADVCVCVGVLKADPSVPMTDIDKGPVDPDGNGLTQGVYAYKGTQTDNFVYLLLDHIYANVHFELVVEQKYAELRTIKIKKVMMSSTTAPFATATVLLSNSTSKPVERVSVEYEPGDVRPVQVTLFDMEKTDEKEPITVSDDALHPTSIPGYFAPGNTTQAFDFEFTYDVYDKQGNLVRENGKAINHWQLTGQTVSAGKSFKVPATIKPTYLYLLSDPDLDNPKFELNVEPAPAPDPEP